MPPEPTLTVRHEDGVDLPLLVWRFDRPLLAVSSAPLGGGIGPRNWLINATVPMSYRRDDPDVHLAGLADGLDLRGPGVGLLTGVDVAQVVSGEDAGVRVWATVGLADPIPAAADDVSAGPVGTINLVVSIPVRLGDAALVNAVATSTEAKAQALWDLGLRATGTATDAVTVLCPTDGPLAPYAGPRSEWGSRIARATHRAVRVGGGGGGAKPPTSGRHDR